MKLIRLVTGCFLFLVSLMVYCISLSAGAYPGESAQFVAGISGLFPAMSPGHPLWVMCATIMSYLPLGGIAARLNIFSALCGAAAVWLMFEVMVSAVLLAVEEDDRIQRMIDIAAWSAGVVAAVCMAFCVPFWMVSTRAHFLGFDIMMLLVAFRIMCAAARSLRRPGLYVLAVLSGLMCAESAMFIMFLPLFVVWTVIVIRSDEDAKASAYILPALLFMAGLTLYFIAALMFMGSEGYVLRGYTGYWHVLTVIAQDQYVQIARSLPRQKWLIILMVTVIPWIAAMMSGRRALNGERGFWLIALHVLLTAIGVSLVLNIDYLSPWRIMGGMRLLVTPYVLSAAVLGYLAAYWLLYFKVSAMQTESHTWERTAPVLGYSSAVSLIVLVVAMPFLNFSSADGRKSELIARMCGEIIESMEGRTWLVSNGFLDNHLLIAAKERGIKLNIISMKGDVNEIYAKYNAARFDSARLKNLANISTLQMVLEWFAMDKGAAAKTAILSESDIWYGAGLVPMPNKMVFLGVAKPDAADVRKALDGNKEFWGRMQDAGGARLTDEPILGAYIDYLQRHASMVANNMGVLLEDNSMEKEAYGAYSISRKMFPGNISALLNMYSLASSGLKVNDAAAIKTEVDALVKDKKARYSAWSLSRVFGYVRHSRTYADNGWIWALSGQPGIAASGFKRAVDLAPAENKPLAKQQLAEFYLTQNMGKESEAIYRELLAVKPDNTRALLGLIRIKERDGELAEVKKLLDVAEKAGLDKTVLSYEMAMYSTLLGDNDKARVLLQDIIQLQPGYSPAWFLLVDVMVRQKDKDGLDELIRESDKTKDLSGLVDYARSQQSILSGAWGQALSFTEKALSKNPGNIRLLVQAMRMSVMQARKDDAFGYANRILKQESSHPFANYIMGSIMSSRGNYSQAKDFLQKSIEKERTAPAVNDLAWVCLQLCENSEAERLAREALKISPDLYTALDTLGMVLLETGRLAEAEKLFNKAITLNPKDFRIQLNLAELYAKQGNSAKQAELVSTLKKNISHMSTADQERLTRLSR